MVASKSMHIKYSDLCPICRDNAKLEGKVVVKKLCIKCKRVYYKRADQKKKEVLAERAGNVDLTKNKGNILTTQMNAVAKVMRHEIRARKARVLAVKQEIKKVKEQLRKIKSIKKLKKDLVNEKKEMAKLRNQLREINIFIKNKKEGTEA